MTEVVVAVFTASPAADAAVQDLKVARIPSAVIQQEVSDPALHQDSKAVWPSLAGAWQKSSVTVAVDERHAGAVTGILRQYGPLKIEERAEPPRPKATKHAVSSPRSWWKTSIAAAARMATAGG